MNEFDKPKNLLRAEASVHDLTRQVARLESEKDDLLDELHAAALELKDRERRDDVS